MPSFFDECRHVFGSDDFYEILKIRKECNESAVKRAYHKLSLKVHPDRVSGDEKDSATQKFQTLGKVYSILSDKDKRAVYDETGEIDEENDVPQDRDWYDYWRLLFNTIGVKEILEFEEKYKGSDEELADLKSAYMNYDGDMDLILENVFCTTIDDEPRFRKILDGLIKKEEIPKYKAYTEENESKKKARKRKADQEAREAEEERQRKGLGDGDDALKKMIQQRQQTREQGMNSFFDQLEAKYAQKPNGKKKSKKTK